MLIIRRDLETILQVMDRFGATEQVDAVEFIYNDTDSGYDLAIKFSDFVHDVMCDIEVVITPYTLGDNNERTN